MIRRIIQIDGDRCNGCGACAAACHEGAIGMVNGRAVLLRDDYCDGLGDCLPNCPAGAISFVEREAAAYDHQAVLENRKSREPGTGPHVCPGQQVKELKRMEGRGESAARQSQLAQWPCQIRLAPARAPYFDGCGLLAAADCTAYAYAGMHQDFMKGKVTLIGCPKLDAADYSEKLAQIIAQNDVRSVDIVRMEVPCCGGLEHAAKEAVQKSGKAVPVQVAVISVEGQRLRNFVE